MAVEPGAYYPPHIPLPRLARLNSHLVWLLLLEHHRFWPLTHATHCISRTQGPLRQRAHVTSSSLFRRPDHFHHWGLRHLVPSRKKLGDPLFRLPGSATILAPRRSGGGGGGGSSGTGDLRLHGRGLRRRSARVAGLIYRGGLLAQRFPVRAVGGTSFVALGARCRLPGA